LLLIAAVGKHPYGFYMVLRLVITVGAVYWARRAYKARLRGWAWAFVAVALLLNPFLPIRMQRAQWQSIDLWLGILLIGWSGYWLFRKQTRASQRQTLVSLQDGQAYKWPGTGAYQKVGTSAGETAASAGARAASPRGTSSAKGWETDWTLYRIVWTALCLLLGGGFSLAVSAPDSGLGLIVVSAMAFGGFASAALLWSRAISKVLSKIGVTTFARQVTITGCLIVCAIHALNSVGSFAARSSTPETQLRTSVSGTSALPVPNQNKASVASKRAVTKRVSGASPGCHPPVSSQQELAALKGQAANGNAAAQCGLGMMYIKAQGVPQDYAKALLWLGKAAEQGNAEAQHNLGLMYHEGHGVPQDYAQATFWYRKAAGQGDAYAQYDLGVLYDNGHGVPQDYAQAAFWYRKAAEQGDAYAQYNLGVMYREGHGVPQDYAQAATWFLKAAEQGDPDAQYNLGVLYYEQWKGQGVPRNDTQAAFWCRRIRAWREWINSADPYNQPYTQAVFWFRKAAEQGDAGAQDALGNLYYDGHGPLSMQLFMHVFVHGRYAQAALWYRKAAEQGDADAEYSLGMMYEDGWGVPQDDTQAAAWLRKAAEQGDADAQWPLGGLYLDGKGVPRSYAEAYFWYDLAAAGEQDASDSRQVAKY